MAALQRKDAVHHLHSKLRDCVDMMGVGGAKQARADTVVEDSAAVQRASSDGKDLGDVKCVFEAPYSRIGVGVLSMGAQHPLVCNTHARDRKYTIHSGCTICYQFRTIGRVELSQLAGVLAM